jgi:hypothetical protein
MLSDCFRRGSWSIEKKKIVVLTSTSQVAQNLCSKRAVHWLVRFSLLWLLQADEVMEHERPQWVAVGFKIDIMTSRVLHERTLVHGCSITICLF